MVGTVAFDMKHRKQNGTQLAGSLDFNTEAVKTGELKARITRTRATRTGIPYSLFDDTIRPKLRG